MATFDRKGPRRERERVPTCSHRDHKGELCATCPGADKAPLGVQVIVTDAAPEGSAILASIDRDPATGQAKIIDAVRVINLKP